MAKFWLPSASVIFRGRPRTSAMRLGGGWGQGVIWTKWGGRSKWKTPGRNGRRISPASFVGSPRFSFTGDGSGEFRWRN